MQDNLQTSTLHDLLEISIEGAPLSDFNADAAIKLWWSSCFGGHRVNQKERKEYTPRACSSAITDSEEDSNSTFALDDWDQLFSDIQMHAFDFEFNYKSLYCVHVHVHVFYVYHS